MYTCSFTKNDCMKLYYAFLKNKELDYPEFIEAINKELNKKYDIEDLKKYIVCTKRYFSVSNGEAMKNILKYTLSKKKDKSLLQNVENKDFNGRIIIENKLDLEEKLKYINDNMDLIISGEETINSLYKKGILTNQGFMIEVKKYVKYIDKNKYIEFLIKNHDLNLYTSDELYQYLSVIKYFLKNINNKLGELNKLDPVKDYEKVKQIYISEQDNLSETYKTNPLRLHTWKKQKLERLLKVYNEVFDSMKNLVKNNDINDLKRLSDATRLFLKNEEDFILEYYKDLKALKDEYKNSINSLKDLNDSDKKEIGKIYIKKVIKENN